MKIPSLLHSLVTSAATIPTDNLAVLAIMIVSLAVIWTRRNQ